jgi:hypothetical protein
MAEGTDMKRFAGEWGRGRGIEGGFERWTRPSPFSNKYHEPEGGGGGGLVK